jgi:hypothetical protein
MQNRRLQRRHFHHHFAYDYGLLVKLVTFAAFGLIGLVIFGGIALFDSGR